MAKLRRYRNAKHPSKVLNTKVRDEPIVWHQAIQECSLGLLGGDDGSSPMSGRKLDRHHIETGLKTRTGPWSGALLKRPASKTFRNWQTGARAPDRRGGNWGQDKAASGSSSNRVHELVGLLGDAELLVRGHDPDLRAPCPRRGLAVNRRVG